MANRGRSVIHRTVYSQIRAFGLESYCPDLVLQLTVQRLGCYRLRVHWNMAWDRVVFRDGSGFCIGMHDDRIRGRRRRGERHEIQFFAEKRVHQAMEIMVWVL